MQKLMFKSILTRRQLARQLNSSRDSKSCIGSELFQDDRNPNSHDSLIAEDNADTNKIDISST